MILVSECWAGSNFRIERAVCFWFDGIEGRVSGCFVGVLVSLEFELSEGWIGFIGSTGFPRGERGILFVIFGLDIWFIDFLILHIFIDIFRFWKG